MTWLVANIWMSLGLAAIFGLLFGWAFRGITLKGRARDALVQRDVAMTELDQVKLELDELYAAQTKQADTPAEAGDPALLAQLQSRDEKLAALTADLAASKEALADLKTKAAAGAAVAGAAAIGAMVTGRPEAEERLDAGLNKVGAELEWRNRYLESRVRSLETKISEFAPEPSVDVDAITASLATAQAEIADLGQKAEAGAAELVSAQGEIASLTSRLVELEAEAVEASQEAPVSGPDAEKLGWQAAYLRQRLASMETNPPAERAMPVEDEAMVSAADADNADQALAASAAEKLAWQASYLRQRLAFLEANPPADRVVADDERVDSVPEAPQIAADEGTISAEKLLWQASYLRQRLDYLEANPPKDRNELVVSVEDMEIDALDEETDDEEALGDDVSAVDIGAMEQELARLRWRNRYLEGRLAYIDGDAPKSDAELATEASVEGPAEGIEAEAEETAETEASEPPAIHRFGEIEQPEAASAATIAAIASAVESAGQVPDEDDVEAEAVESNGADVAASDVAEAGEASFANPAEAFLATMESDGTLVKPDMIERPEDGGDDLTKLKGIGNSTAERLNDIGVWRFEQIAKWTEANIAWVNRHLGEEGRIEQSEWLSQVQGLLEGQAAAGETMPAAD